MLSVSVLGPLEVYRHDTRLRIPSGKPTELLVRLALEAGELVSAERLIQDLWVEEAVHTRPNTLQSKVATLRRALGDASLVTGRQSGYVLEVSRDQIDALRVLDHLAEAERLVEAGDDPGAERLSATATPLFRGPLLHGAGDAPWVASHRARLDDAHRELLAIQYAARLRLGRASEVVGDLRSSLELHPYDEALWELLITALYRAGLPADALTAFRQVRALLAEELGLDPGPGLAALESRILSHDPSLGGRGEEHRPSARVTGGNLPTVGTALVARSSEVADVVDGLQEGRLVVLVGPGGVGKTALALEVGRETTVAQPLRDVWVARLEGAMTTQDVYDVLVGALAGPPGVEAMFEAFRGSEALIILDNCEHLVDACAELATRLLDASPTIHVLCTSQVPLEIDGERVIEVAPLPLDDAIELFHRRAHHSLTPREPTDPQAVAELCGRLDGLPLAIELAAARSRTLPVGEINRRLATRFQVLTDPASRKPERRRSLRATIRWSYELLFPDDQRGLWALAAFATGASLPAFSAVLTALGVPADAAIDIVGRLAARSLLLVDDEGRTRYRLLDSIRAFAREAAAEAGAAGVVGAAHAHWYAAAAERSTAGVRGAAQAEFLDLARAERADIDVALGWCATHDPAMALRIATGFGWSWVVLGDSRGAQRILTALDAAPDAPVVDRITALLLASWIEASTERLELAATHVAQATELAGLADDPELSARCLYYRAYVVSHQGDFPLALELTTRCREAYGRLDHPWDQAANALFEARAALSAGDHARSVEAVQRVTTFLAAVDDPWLQCRGEAVQGELARMESRFEDAIGHLRQAVEVSGRLGFPQTQAYQTTTLGRVLCQAGRVAEGLAALDLAIERSHSVGDSRLVALSRIHLGRAARAAGDPVRARASLEPATTWYRTAGGGEHAAIGESLLAALDAAAGTPGAVERLDRVLLDAKAASDDVAAVFALDALARLRALEGRQDVAAELLHEADRHAAGAGHLVKDLERTDAQWLRPLLADAPSAG